MKQVYKKGSFTVEAAYIVPMITLIIVVLLYGVMVLHDRGRTLMINSYFAEKEVALLSLGENISDKDMLIEDIYDMCKKKNFVCHFKNSEYYYDKINLTLKGNITGRFKAFKEKAIKVKYFIPRYTDIIRTQRVVD